MYSYDEVMTFVEEEDVKFIRLAFCDVQGKQKNISIMPSELGRAFLQGISFDASAIYGFGDEARSDLLLRPDPSTLSVLPWRPSHGRVVRMFCDVINPDGTPFERDCRDILRRAVRYAEEKGVHCNFGTEVEFYLFKTDENGDITDKPYDNAGYMDIAPEDKGENVRREICLTLLEMGITPESSHHESGPGQNEIDFRYSDPVTAADNVVTFKSDVRTIAMRNGLGADFSPKPLAGHSGNGMHINISVNCDDGVSRRDAFMAGVLAHCREMTAVFNPSRESYRRLGEQKAPKYVSWSPENRSQLIRIPAANGDNERIEVRSPDPTANPYLAFALLIYAGLEGIERELEPCAPVNENLYTAGKETTDKLERLPENRDEAIKIASGSEFVKKHLPAGLIEMLKR